MTLANENVWTSILDEVNSTRRECERDLNIPEIDENASDIAEEMKIFDIFNEIKSRKDTVLDNCLEDYVKFFT